MIARQLTRRAGLLRPNTRLVSSSRICQEANVRNGPTHTSRTSPKDENTPEHPGYTPYDTPVSSAHPSTMPGPSSTAQIASQTTQASTRAHPPHQDIQGMASGAESGGEGAVKPEERNVKGWGPNAVSGQLNVSEGQRNPVLHGGSNEGGHDSQGKSKT